jgi:hypothetical protein
MRSEDPFSQEQIMQGVKVRGQVHIEVKRDVKHAYTLARSIKHPWYRCQALAQVADHANLNEIESILKESFSSALSCHDENRRVTVGCWTLRVALKHQLMELAKIFLGKLVYQVNQDMDPLSKWCAVTVLYTIKTHSELLEGFFPTFAKATAKGYGWQVERHIKYLLLDDDIKNNRKYDDHLSTRLDSILRWKK